MILVLFGVLLTAYFSVALRSVVLTGGAFSNSLILLNLLNITIIIVLVFMRRG